MSLKNKRGIYMLFNVYNNKCYVGSTNNFYRRKNEHFNYLRNNKHHSDHLQKAYNKYGEDKFIFIVLEECKIENFISREIFWIKIKNSLDSKYGYNIAIPQKNESLIPREETTLKKIVNSYNQFYKDNRISLEEFIQGKRAKDLLEKFGAQNKERTLVFNKNTGIKEYEFESIIQSALFFNCEVKKISEVCNRKRFSYKGYIFVKEKDYDPLLEYKKVSKAKESYYNYKLKGPFQGNPLETFNLETKETIKIYNNRKEIAEEFNTTTSYIAKVLSGEKKSFRGMGVRRI